MSLSKYEVIENFILYYASEDKEREQMKNTLKDYLELQETKEEDEKETANRNKIDNIIKSLEEVKRQIEFSLEELYEERNE